MAVKVMLAPALMKPQPAPALPEEVPPPRPEGPSPGKVKRRRSSVFDADGNEVFITLMCLKCKKMRPLSLFGLRRMADGAIRNQPWCRSCRSAATPSDGSRKRSRRAIGDAHGQQTLVGDAVAGGPPGRTEGRDLAAQVSAALNGGRG